MSKEFLNGKNALIVNLCGEIDQYATAQLKEKIDIELECSSKPNLIFDLSEVTLMDSSGIGLIVGRYKSAQALGGTLLLCGATPSVRRMIELSGIGKVIKSYESIAKAEKALEKSE